MLCSPQHNLNTILEIGCPKDTYITSINFVNKSNVHPHHPPTFGQMVHSIDNLSLQMYPWYTLRQHNLSNQLSHWLYLIPVIHIMWKFMKTSNTVPNHIFYSSECKCWVFYISWVKVGYNLIFYIWVSNIIIEVIMDKNPI